MIKIRKMGPSFLFVGLIFGLAISPVVAQVPESKVLSADAKPSVDVAADSKPAADTDAESTADTDASQPSETADAQDDTNSSSKDDETVAPKDAAAVPASGVDKTSPGAEINTETEPTTPQVVTSNDSTKIEASSETEKKKRSFFDEIKKKPKFKVGAQLAGLWRLQDEPFEPSNEFLLNRARLKLSWKQGKATEAVLKVEARELFSGGGADSLLRDLYVRVQPVRWLGIRVGQFKKPFGGSALTSWRKHGMVERGISNDYIIEHLMYGDRDIGAMLEGRLVKSIKLDYALGVFNGMGMNRAELGFGGSKDIVARLEVSPVKWLNFGANASYKFMESEDLSGFVNTNNFALVEEDEYPLGYSEIDFAQEYEWMEKMWWMYGLDAVVSPGNWTIAAEGMFGRNWWFTKYRYTWSTALRISYKQKIAKGTSLWIEPIVQAEVLSFLPTDLDTWRNRLWQITPGVNLHIGKYVRLMVNGELVFAQGSEADIDGSRRDGLWPNEYPGNWTDSKRLLLQLAFNR